MKKIAIFLILTLMLSSCSSYIYSNKVDIKQVENPDLHNDLLHQNYSIIFKSSNPTGFMFMMFGFIIPIFPIPACTSCNGKTYIDVWIFNKDNEVKKIDNITRNIVLYVIFDNSEVIEYEIGMQILSSKKSDYLFGIAELPISCTKWKTGKIKLENIYINGVKQKPLEFVLDKKSEWKLT
jgi:hypothetical protein